MSSPESVPEVALEIVSVTPEDVKALTDLEIRERLERIESSMDDIRKFVKEIHDQAEPMLTALSSSPLLGMLGVKIGG